MIYELTVTDPQMLAAAQAEMGGAEPFTVACRAVLEGVAKQVGQDLRLSDHISGKVGELEERFDCYFLDAKCLCWLRSRGASEVFLESAEFVSENKAFILWAKQKDGPPEYDPTARLLIAAIIWQNILQAKIDYEKEISQAD